MSWTTDEHDRHAREWRHLWDRLDPIRRRVDLWRTPWLDQSWKDGNPIFSAWSPKLRRGVRLLQHPDTKGLAVWRDTFGSNAEAIDELVISCDRTPASIQSVEQLLGKWLDGNPTLVMDVRQPPPTLAA